MEYDLSATGKRQSPLVWKPAVAKKMVLTRTVTVPTGLLSAALTLLPPSQMLVGVRGLEEEVP